MEFNTIRAAIVHRDGLYRDSLGRCLTQDDAMSIVYSSSRFDELKWVVAEEQPDLLLVEFGLCRCHGPLDRVTLGLPVRMVKTIVIGVPETEDEILACIEREGAAGYLLMDASVDDLLMNIRAVMKGETLCSPKIAGLAFNRMSALARQVEIVRTEHGKGLTRREAEIVWLIDKGLSNKEIATRLNIGVSTVKNHVHNILDKLQLHNRYSAVKFIRNQAILTGHS
jgi:DNA-binding NarL/FixJ family response regulator